MSRRRRKIPASLIDDDEPIINTKPQEPSEKPTSNDNTVKKVYPKKIIGKNDFKEPEYPEIIDLPKHCKLTHIEAINFRNKVVLIEESNKCPGSVRTIINSLSAFTQALVYAMEKNKLDEINV